MQIEITPQVVVATIGIGMALQSAIIAVAVMIRGTAKDLARESKEREDAEKATESRFAVVERDVQNHSVGLRALEIRTDGMERTLGSTTATVAAHGQALAALAAARPEDRPRSR